MAAFLIPKIPMESQQIFASFSKSKNPLWVGVLKEIIIKTKKSQLVSGTLPPSAFVRKLVWRRVLVKGRSPFFSGWPYLRAVEKERHGISSAGPHLTRGRGTWSLPNQKLGHGHFLFFNAPPPFSGVTRTPGIMSQEEPPLSWPQRVDVHTVPKAKLCLATPMAQAFPPALGTHDVYPFGIPVIFGISSVYGAYMLTQCIYIYSTCI